MMMNRFKRISLGLLVMAFAISMAGAPPAAASGNTGMAEKRHMKERPSMLKALHALRLSEEQKKEVAAVFKKYRDTQKGNLTSLLAAREKLSKAIYSDGYNESAVREAFRNVAAAQEEMTVVRAKIASEVNAVLTPEQKTRLQELRAKMFSKARERFNSGKKSPMDSWIEKHS